MSNPSDSSLVITRPRRFGKSLLMSMVKYFLDENVDAEEAKLLFDGTLIAEDKVLCAQHQQKYVVLHIDFKNITGSDADRFAESFRKCIYVTVYHALKKLNDEEHGQLVNDPSYRTLHNVSLNVRLNEPENSYTDALSDLLKVFHQLNKPVIVLIDEYDHPLIDAYNKGYLDSARNLIQGFLSALKGGIYHKVLLTGVLRVSKDSMLSELNNLKTYDVMSDPYNRDFGFTEAEMEALYAKFPEVTETQREAAKDWYNGYSFGEDDVATVYNPWAIASFLGSSDKRPKNYWVATGATTLLQNIVAQQGREVENIKVELLQFVEGAASSTIPACHRLTIDYKNPKFIFEQASSDATMFWKLLLHAGYLTGEYLTAESPRIQLRAPNKEVLSEFSGLMHSCFSSLGSQVPTSPFGKLDRSPEYMRGTYRSLHAILKVVPSYWDIINERSLHAMILGLAAADVPITELSSNREAGDGRPDMVLKQPDLGHAFLFEFKYVKTSAFADRSAPEVLFEAAQQAMAQMTDRDYVQSLAGEKGIEHLVYVGLAYGKKQVMMIYDVAPVSHTTEGLPVLGERETGRAFWDIGEYHPQEKVYLSSNQPQGWEDLELVEF